MSVTDMERIHTIASIQCTSPPHIDPNSESSALVTECSHMCAPSSCQQPLMIYKMKKPPLSLASHKENIWLNPYSDHQGCMIAAMLHAVRHESMLPCIAEPASMTACNICSGGMDKSRPSQCQQQQCEGRGLGRLACALADVAE
jgi:hypothetical protein